MSICTALGDLVTFIGDISSAEGGTLCCCITLSRESDMNNRIYDLIGSFFFFKIVFICMISIFV